MDQAELDEQDAFDARQEREKARVSHLETMRDLLSQARIRLDQYIGMCRCPGESCVSACGECNRTQGLVNDIRAFMKVQTPR